MAAFLLRRFLASIVVLFFAVSLTFLLTRSLRGGPFDKEKGSAQVTAAQEAKYKLNGTLWQQYVAYINDLGHLDLRVSTRYKDWTVAEVLGQKLPNSIQLGGIAFVIASTLGVFIGALAAMRRDGWMDLGATLGALIAISIPTFTTAPHRMKGSRF